MSRVSQLELYNDKDVITQILLMKEQVVTGTYKDVSVTDDGAGNLVFVFTDQNDDPTTFTIPVKLISTVTSSQSGSTVTMRITWTDGTHTDLSWTAGGDVTTNTNQTISAVKTFSASPIIPDTPSGTHAAVNLTYVSKTDGTNNLLHTSAAETASGLKTFSSGIVTPITRVNDLVNINGLTRAFVQIDTVITQGHSVSFTVHSRLGVANVHVVTNSANTAITTCDVETAGGFDTLKLVLAVDSTPGSERIYLGVNGSTDNTIVAISNLVMYRGGSWLQGFIPSDADISGMTLLPIEVTP